MKLTYDPKHNIAYISLQAKKNARVETLHLSDSLNVDIAPDGTVYGIELLNANKQLKGKGKAKFIIENIATGKSTQLDY
jgi:uncharacterized protein YuzE